MKPSSPSHRLDSAERSRTLVSSAGDLTLQLRGVGYQISRHVVMADGTVLFLAPGDEQGLVSFTSRDLVMVTAIDVADVAQRDRIRGMVRLFGALAPALEPMPVGVEAHLGGPLSKAVRATSLVVALRPFRVELEWRCEQGEDEGGADVSVPAYRRAQPDPLMAHESAWLCHLDAEHADLLHRLVEPAGHEDQPFAQGPVQVRPLVLDRFGLVLRRYAATGHHDLRVPFSSPVRCACELHDALHALVDAGSRSSNAG